MKSTLEELQAFVSIVDCGSIVAAAQQLSQTNSGVSRALQRLETKLNVTLLERTTRKLKLTEEGRLFLVKARQIIHDLNAAEDALLKSDHDSAGLIRVDSAAPFVLHILVPLLQEFMQCYPNIRIELNSNDQIIDLLEHRTDVAIRFGDLQDSSLHAKWLCSKRLRLAASPSYLEKFGEPQTLADLLDHQLLGFSQSPHQNIWPAYIDGEALRIDPKLKASSGETIRQMSIAGLGICCLSEFLVDGDIAQQRLVSLLDDQIEYKYQNIHAVYYQQAHLPKRVRLFIEFLAEKLSTA